NVTLTADPATGVYTPLWAFSATALANLSSTCAAGACTLWSDEPGPLGQPATGGPSFPWFGESNDFLFPVFPGIWLAHVSSANVVAPPPLSVLPPPWQAAASSRLGIPASNALPTYFYDDANLTITEGTFSNWWFSGGYLGPAAADAAVVLWNTTGSRVTNSTFLTGGEGVYLYGGSGNVVTGDTFLSYTPLAANDAS
ncbi:thermopsin precursor related protein, partial [mine drainage metagenome]